MKNFLLSLSFLFGGPIACQSSPVTLPIPTTVPKPSVTYEIRSHGNSNLHLVRIPSGNHFVTEVAPVSAFKTNAIAVMNAGFFDPVNQKSTSHLTIARQPVARPQENDRLTQNPKLKPYLTQIFNRSELRRYQCESEFCYGITRHDSVVPKNCSLVDAIGAGPQLLPRLTATEEGFWDPTTGRDAIGYDQPNARSAIALTATGEVFLLMVEQRKPGGGLALPQLATVLKELGAVSAMNLDGGTSSALWYDGKVMFGKRDEDGKLVGRSVKSVLVVRSSGN
jgi:hypothetical protein